MKKIFICILFVMVIIFLKFLGKNMNYMAIISNIINIKILTKNINEYYLYKQNNIHTSLIKYINIFIIAIIIVNCIIFKNLKLNLLKNNFLKIIFGILLVKIILSLRLNLQDFKFEIFYKKDILVFFVTKFLGFMMVYYAINKGVKRKKEKKIFSILFIIVFVYTFIYIFSTFDIFYYGYLEKYYPKFINIILFLSKIIDFTKLILLIFIFHFINFRKKINKVYHSSWNVIFILLIFMESSIYIFPECLDVYYFIEIMEFIYLYWLLVFFTTRIYYKKITIYNRIMVTFIIAYVVLFFTELIICTYVVLITEGLLELYTWKIENIVIGNSLRIEGLLSNLSLTNSIEEFQEQLTFQIENILEIDYVTVLLFKYEEDFFKYILKTSSTKDIFMQEEIRVKGYTTGFRISFNSNFHLGLILIRETPYLLNLDEFNFILNLCEKISSQGNRVRINSLYKELA